MRKGLIPIVYIQWMDACSNGNWFSEEHLDEWVKDDAYCSDVGYLVRETKKMLVFAQRHEPELGPDRDLQWGNVHKIPKTWVRSRKVLGYLKRDGTFVERRSK